MLDVLDLEASQGQLFGQLLDRQRDFDVFSQPGDWNAHDDVRLTSLCKMDARF
jgi:hypothetical protein